MNTRPDHNKFYSHKDEAPNQEPSRTQPDFPTQHLLGNLDNLRTPARTTRTFFTEQRHNLGQPTKVKKAVKVRRSSLAGNE